MWVVTHGPGAHKHLPSNKLSRNRQHLLPMEREVVGDQWLQMNEHDAVPLQQKNEQSNSQFPDQQPLKCLRL
jgi:hypothetical protein